MKKAILDLAGCKCPQEMHRRFQKTLQFPEHYGGNWDAFRDCMMNDTDIEFVEIHGENSVRAELRSMLEILHTILEEVKQDSAQQGWAFDYTIID